MFYKIDIKKRIFALVLIPVIILTITFCDYKKVYAVVGVDDVLLASMASLVAVVIATEQSDNYQTWYENDWRPKSRDVIRQGLNVISGIPISSEKFDELFPLLGPDPIQEVRLYMASRNNVEPSTITDDQVKQFTYNMFDNSVVNEDNDSFNVSSDLNNYLHYCVENLIDNSGFRYVYTLNVINYATSFSSGDHYVATRDFISDLQSDNKSYTFNTTYDYGWAMDMSNAAFVRVSESPVAYQVQLYNLTSWEQIPGDKYEYSNGSYNLVQESENNNVLAWVKKEHYGVISFPGYWWYMNSGQNNVYKMYMSLADLKADSVGQAPYYINNSVYNDWSTSSGDYIVTTDNSNKATYGDITSYIDSFNTENGHYPSDTDIFKWIENYDPTVNPTPTPNPDNPSGSGSFVNNNSPVFNNNPNININLLPGDGTVSGNGTGGNSGIGNIFGFLSDIGKFLGDLIKNLGQALVDVIKGIGDLFNSIITELPTVFFDFLGAVFNWLPEDWVRLMGLSFACMLIVGVIKIFRR